MSLTEIITLLGLIVAIAAGIIIPIRMGRSRGRSEQRLRDLEKLNDLSSFITRWYEALIALDIHDRPAVQTFDHRAIFEDELRTRLDTLGRSKYPSIVEKAQALTTEAVRYKGALRQLPSLEIAKKDLQGEISRFIRELS